MSNVVAKQCALCNKKFETSKFTPYVILCKECKGKDVPNSKKIEKAAKESVKSTKKPWVEGAKDTKVWKSKKKDKPVQVLAVPAVPAPKSYVPVENKEAIFLHLLQKGYKLSGMNTPYKVYPKIKVMLPLDGAYTKMLVNYLDSNGRFDGSNILMTKKDTKDLPKEVREELADIIDLIYPEAAK